MKRSVLIAAAAAALTMGQYAAAAGDAAAGEEKSAVCVACHGNDGNSPSAQFPRIGGQHASYLERALIDYKSGARQNAIMAGIVTQLSKQDMADLAAYYAKQAGPLHTPE